MRTVSGKTWLGMQARVAFGGSLSLLLASACGVPSERQGDDGVGRVSLAQQSPWDVPPDEFGIEQFAGACHLSGGGLVSKDEQTACCTICTDTKSCLDVCTDTKALASLKEISAEEDAKLDQLIEEADPGYSERQSGSDVDTYNLCLTLCKWGYNVCTAAPVPVPHDDQFAFCTKGLFWGCIGGCFDWHHD